MAKACPEMRTLASPGCAAPRIEEICRQCEFWLTFCWTDGMFPLIQRKALSGCVGRRTAGNRTHKSDWEKCMPPARGSPKMRPRHWPGWACLLYTSDAADE